LEDWVEKGQAPDKLIASRLSNGVVERTRPIYPYPVLARYSGKGDPKQADSFVPFEPSQHQGWQASRISGRARRCPRRPPRYRVDPSCRRNVVAVFRDDFQ
jgi:Tannase and feruloyl esterase